MSQSIRFVLHQKALKKKNGNTNRDNLRDFFNLWKLIPKHFYCKLYFTNVVIHYINQTIIGNKRLSIDALT